MKRHAILAFAALLAGGGAAHAQAPAPAPPPNQPPVLTYSQPLAPAAVATVQDKLHQQGAYAGPIDGSWGADSEDALQRFQQTHGLQTTGQINQATALLLGLNPPDLLRQTGAASPPPPAAPPVVSPSALASPPVVQGLVPTPPEIGTRLSPAAVRNLQGRLRQLGYYTGGIDSEWGPSSEAALTRFQQASGIPSTGRINPQTVAAMGLDTNDLEAPAR